MLDGRLGESHGALVALDDLATYVGEITERRPGGRNPRPSLVHPRDQVSNERSRHVFEEEHRGLLEHAPVDLAPFVPRRVERRLDTELSRVFADRCFIAIPICLGEDCWIDRCAHTGLLPLSV